MNREANTGVFPPQEENSGFESVEGTTPVQENNTSANSSVEANNGAGAEAAEGQNNAGAAVQNTANAVQVPATALTGVKRSFKDEQAEEFTKLKAAIAAQGSSLKAKATDAAKLASARLKGNPSYQRMFENATAGKKIAELYQNNASAKRRAKINARKTASAVVTNNTAVNLGLKTAKKSRGKAAATVTNSTAAKNNAATVTNNSAALKTAKKSRGKPKNTGFSTQTNLRGINLPNTGAMNAKVDSIVSMAAAISTQVKELMTLAKTLKSGRAAPKNATARKPRGPRKGSRTAVAANSLVEALPLPVPTSNGSLAQENAPLQNSLGFGALSAIPEENEGQLSENNNNGNYTPPN
jgi:hypothetical protein